MEVMAMMKAVLVSTGVVSMAVMLKLSLPVVLDLLTNELSFSLWFKPPYLYLIINCIIISIVASSKLQPRGGEVQDKVVFDEVAVKSALDVTERDGGSGGGEEEEVAVVEEMVFGYVEESDLVKDSSVVDEAVREEEAVVVEESGGGCGVEEREGLGSGGGGGTDVEEREVLGGGGLGGVEEESKVLKSMWILPEDIAAAKTEEVVEKPPVSARFGHRKAVKSSPEGKSGLKKVSRPKRQETLESTWRTLTEGRPMPLTRHLRKSDTFTGTQDSSQPVRVMNKSDTFPATALSASPGSGGSSGGGRLRREPSLSQDDLNRRVEAFIKKFNEQMRLQRQESLNQYKEMVGRY